MRQLILSFNRRHNTQVDRCRSSDVLRATYAGVPVLDRGIQRTSKEWKEGELMARTGHCPASRPSGGPCQGGVDVSYWPLGRQLSCAVSDFAVRELRAAQMALIFQD
jgi:hypothetical protein